MKRTAMEKITPTKELKEYYQKVIDFCKTNNVPFKKLHPVGLSVDLRDIPKDKVEEWISVVSKN
jgi:hypothetical protein